MKLINNIILINGGSSSIKFAAYSQEEKLTEIFSGSIENIGSEKIILKCILNKIVEEHDITDEIKNTGNAVKYLIEWLDKKINFSHTLAIGHRLIYGPENSKTSQINDLLLQELKTFPIYDPIHLPVEIELIEIFTKRYPTIVQFACFDTSFHNSMPQIAKQLSIPERYFKKGIHRYGFHGLSYAFLMDKLRCIDADSVMNGKIILAHLGSGASLAAIKNGQCQDTTMGITPAGGIIMGTRTGDIDPGLAIYLMQVEKMSIQQFSNLINKESGLLGISGISSDMKKLIELKNTDTNAANAFEMFCYQIKKQIGAYAAALEGLDTLVFSGGIGEHSPEVRSQICDGLEFMGIDIDEIKNMNNESVISSDSSKIIVRVIPTNEQLMMAEMVREEL